MNPIEDIKKVVKKAKEALLEPRKECVFGYKEDNRPCNYCQIWCKERK